MSSRLAITSKETDELSPCLYGVLLSMLLCGVVLAQSVEYGRTFTRDPKWLRLMVASLTASLTSAFALINAVFSKLAATGLYWSNAVSPPCLIAFQQLRSAERVLWSDSQLQLALCPSNVRSFKVFLENFSLRKIIPTNSSVLFVLNSRRHLRELREQSSGGHIDAVTRNKFGAQSRTAGQIAVTLNTFTAYESPIEEEEIKMVHNPQWKDPRSNNLSVGPSLATHSERV
ncbi:hypothetical protein P7C70_g1679, partial [Phenoliferia sp. Uapishka_3]